MLLPEICDRVRVRVRVRVRFRVRVRVWLPLAPPLASSTDRVLDACRDTLIRVRVRVSEGE